MSKVINKQNRGMLAIIIAPKQKLQRKSKMSQIQKVFLSLSTSQI